MISFLSTYLCLCLALKSIFILFFHNYSFEIVLEGFYIFPFLGEEGIHKEGECPIVYTSGAESFGAASSIREQYKQYFFSFFRSILGSILSSVLHRFSSHSSPDFNSIHLGVNLKSLSGIHTKNSKFI